MLMPPPSRFRLQSFLAVVSVVMLASQLHAGGIVEPTQVTAGTPVIINGIGFDGGATPKVFAVTDGSNKKMGFKVLSYSDTVLSVQVKKVPSSKSSPAAGRSWTLMVQPRGGQAGPLLEMGNITSVAPQVVSVEEGGFAPGETVVVQVRDAGTAKPRVTIHGKKAKVISSVPSPGAGGLLDLRDFGVKVPNTHDGFFDVTVATKVGADASDQMVQIAGSTRPLPKDGLKATVGGKSLRAKGDALEVFVDDGQVLLNVQTGKSVIRQLVLTLPFDVSLENPPLRFTDDPASIGYGEIHPDGSAPGWSTNVGTMDILVNSRIDGHFHVTFHALLVEEGVQGEPTTRAVEGTVVFAGQSQ